MAVFVFNAYVAELLGVLACLHALSLIQPSFINPPQSTQHRLDNSSVVSTANEYYYKPDTNGFVLQQPLCGAASTNSSHLCRAPFNLL